MREPSVSAELFGALPLTLKRELVRSHGSDAAIGTVLAAIADSRIPVRLSDELARGLVEEARKFSSAVAIGRQLPMRLMPFLPGYAGQGLEQGPIGGPSPRNVGPVARLPYSLFSTTDLTPGIGTLTNADPQLYINGEQYEFVVTHVTFSEGVEPVVLAPTFGVRIAFAQNGKQWMRNIIPVQSFLSYAGTNLTIPTTPTLPLTRWKLAAPYTLNRYGSLFTTASNNASFGIDTEVGYVGYKRDGVGTPRVFTSRLALAANTINVPFNSADFRNDGDADTDITDFICSPGPAGTWGGVNPTAPQVLIRPDGNTGSTKGWTGNGQFGALVTGLNTAGSYGAYWELAVPQRVAPGTTITIEIANDSAGPKKANIGFVGYLEVRQ